VRKAQASEGVSVIEVRRQGDTWQFVQDSRYNRRIHGNSPIRLSGPAAGHDWLKTSADKSGKKALGTFQNCANGKTPWGTYLTCEENFTDCFGSSNPQQTFDAGQKRYGVVAASKEINWHLHDPRFDMAKNPNELNRHGWVVEIDPFDPHSPPSNAPPLAASSMKTQPSRKPATAAPWCTWATTSAANSSTSSSAATRSTTRTPRPTKTCSTMARCLWRSSTPATATPTTPRATASGSS